MGAPPVAGKGWPPFPGNGFPNWRGGLPQGTDRQSLELALHVARAAALMPLKAFTAPETIAAFRAAKRLLDAGVGNDSQRFFVLSGLYSTPHIAGRLESALELAREFVEAAEQPRGPLQQ